MAHDSPVGHPWRKILYWSIKYKFIRLFFRWGRRGRRGERKGRQSEERPSRSPQRPLQRAGQDHEHHLQDRLQQIARALRHREGRSQHHVHQTPHEETGRIRCGTFVFLYFYLSIFLSHYLSIINFSESIHQLIQFLQILFDYLLSLSVCLVCSSYVLFRSCLCSSVRHKKQANGLGNVSYEIGPRYVTKVNKT